MYIYPIPVFKFVVFENYTMKINNNENYLWRKISEKIYFCNEKSRFWIITPIRAFIVLDKSKTAIYCLPNIFVILTFFLGCSLLLSDYEIILNLSNNNFVDNLLSAKGKQLLTTQILPCLTLYTMMYFGFALKHCERFLKNIEKEL